VVQLINPMLEFVQVFREFETERGRLAAVEGISLSAAAGEIVALVGPSGCGKTTLLNLAAGILRPTRGRVVLTPNARLAYAFQEPRLLPWKTVEENISFVQEGLLPAGEAAAARRRILEETGLAEFRRAYPRELSGGMKQRLELARALAVRPRLLLLDEPFRSLDGATRQELHALLQSEHGREGFSALLVTHDPEEAVLLADRVVVLSPRPARILKEVVLATPRKRRLLNRALVSSSLERIEGLLSAAG
jgi:NitT/TauT family transport system ATP-binding protein